MYDIYDHHAAQYDELVDAEDYEGHLKRHLLELTDWEDKRVIEAGVGTGRVTQMYAQRAASVVCVDRSAHMLDGAARRLSNLGKKISFRTGDNLAFPRVTPPSDVFIEGWSWGHSVIDSPDSVEMVTARLLDSARDNLAREGTVIIIETLGTNTETPAAPHPRLAAFYDLLANKHSFQREVLRTDYRFSSADDAIRIMGFFFGDSMRADLEKSRLLIIPEWTGVWHLRLRPARPH